MTEAAAERSRGRVCAMLVVSSMAEKRARWTACQ